MFKDFIKQDASALIYPLFSLVMFILFFTVLIIRVWSKSSKEYDSLSQMPLDKNEHENSTPDTK